MFNLLCLFVSLSLCLFVSLSLCLFVSLSLCLFVSLSLCPFVPLSLCPLITPGMSEQNIIPRLEKILHIGGKGMFLFAVQVLPFRGQDFLE